jgi:NAD(P)-dependent dehydrogenase (short-subunit alcohol dehydrogenase family)
MRPALFDGRAAIVTGASSGIGREIAMALAAHGARVGLLARRKDELKALADEIAYNGGVALAVPCDVTDSAQVASEVRNVLVEFGSIDILVNSAGVAVPDPLEEARLEDLRRMMEVNYFGTVHMIRAVLPVMRSARRGNIVNVGSTAGRRGEQTLTGYCASKFALVGFTEALIVELFGTGITASLVMPGPVDTPMLDNPHWQSRRALLSGVVVPASWVASAVIAAIVWGLAEVDVPPGSGTAQKMASLFPNFAGPWYALGSRMFEAFNAWAGGAPRQR